MTIQAIAIAGPIAAVNDDQRDEGNEEWQGEASSERWFVDSNTSRFTPGQPVLDSRGQLPLYILYI